MVNVAKGARRIYGAELSTPACAASSSRMSEEAARLFQLAIDAYVERNAAWRPPSTTSTTASTPPPRLHRGHLRAPRRPATSSLQAAVQLALIGRYYERIGDHAVNIGERVQYMVTGWLPEQTGAARLRARAHEAEVHAAEERAAELPSSSACPTTAPSRWPSTRCWPSRPVRSSRPSWWWPSSRPW